MQKSLRINIVARNQAIKRVHKQKEKFAKEEWQQWHRQKISVDRMNRQYLKDERKARREDWLAGPLAPNRNSGVEKGSYGAVHVQAIQTPEVPENIRGIPNMPGFEARDWNGVDKKKRFEGKTIVGNVVENDRVAIVHGPERLRGLIGTVTAIEVEKEEIRLKNLNNVDIRLPDGHPQALRGALFQTTELAIPMSWVRLVIQHHNPETGEETPMIVRHVHAGAPYVQRAFPSNLPAHTRYITGSETSTASGNPLQIPWPEEELGDSLQRADVDTDREDVVRSNWLPVMTQAPLGYSSPDSVRNPGEPSTPYLAGIVTNKAEATNAERAGLHGFRDYNKAAVRQTRIAAGIMDELRNKARRNNAMHDDPEWAKTKILEDARSIWWRDRQILSPTAEAMQRQVEDRRKRLEAGSVPGPWGSRKHLMTPELEQLVLETQKLKLTKQPSQS